MYSHKNIQCVHVPIAYVSLLRAHCPHLGPTGTGIISYTSHEICNPDLKQPWSSLNLSRIQTLTALTWLETQPNQPNQPSISRPFLAHQVTYGWRRKVTRQDSPRDHQSIKPCPLEPVARFSQAGILHLQSGSE